MNEQLTIAAPKPASTTCGLPEWVGADWPRMDNGEPARCACGSYDLDDCDPPEIICNTCLARHNTGEPVDFVAFELVDGIAVPRGRD